MDTKILMPRGTALWLKQNTTLTNRQIAQFCELDLMLVTALSSQSDIPFCPVDVSVSEEEIRLCQLEHTRPISRIASAKSSKQHKVLNRDKKIAVLHWFLSRGAKNYKKLAQLLRTNVSFIQKAEDTAKKEELHPSAIGMTQEEIRLIVKV